MEKILTTRQMSICEQQSDKLGVSLGQLMDNAGEKLGRKIFHICTQKNTHSCTILAGKGNNGGDGLCAANFLVDRGINVSVILCCGKPSTELSIAAFSRLNKAVEIIDELCEKTYALIEKSEVLVDCIFGTGFHGNLRDDIKDIFIAANNCKGYKLACDIPSGANAQNGMADKLTFKADSTLTFHRKKLGMLLSPCKYFCGQIETADIDIKPICENSLDIDVRLCDEEYAKSILPERIPYGHKGTFGKLTIVCGCDNYIGAAGLCTTSALRSGIGMCNLCSTEKVISSLSSRILECTYTRLSTDENGFATEDNALEILKKCENSDCILIGCGLGHTVQTEKLVAMIIENSPCTVVCDADGINSLAANIDVLQKKKSDVILTPHPMELSRLCGCEISEVLSDRLKAAKALCDKYDVTVYAKGAESICVTKKRAVVIQGGNTALAKGGSGDMLAGIISSMYAQGCSSEDACVLSGYIMGKTAEMLSRTRSQRGILASDIIDALPEFLLEFED